MSSKKSTHVCETCAKPTGTRGRPAVFVPDWNAVRAGVFTRSLHQCAACRRRGSAEPERMKKAS